MSIVCYLDITDEDNDAAVAAIVAEEDPAQVVFRNPAVFQTPDADPLETIVYAPDASETITDQCTALGITAISIETFMEP